MFEEIGGYTSGWFYQQKQMLKPQRLIEGRAHGVPNELGRNVLLAHKHAQSHIPGNLLFSWLFSWVYSLYPQLWLYPQYASLMLSTYQLCT